MILLLLLLVWIPIAILSLQSIEFAEKRDIFHKSIDFFLLLLFRCFNMHFISMLSTHWLLFDWLEPSNAILVYIDDTHQYKQEQEQKKNSAHTTISNCYCFSVGNKNRAILVEIDFQQGGLKTTTTTYVNIRKKGQKTPATTIIFNIIPLFCVILVLVRAPL